MPNNVVFSNPGASLVQWGDGAATPYLTLSSVPTSGTVGVAVTGLVTNPGAVSAQWTVATSPADTIVSPSSGTLSPGAAVAFTLTALASGLKNVQLTSSTPDCVISGSPASFTAASVGGTVEPPTTGGLTITKLRNGLDGLRPFAFGQAFAEGDLASTASLNGAQLNVLTTWPDTTVKTAIVSGYATITAATDRPVALVIGTAATGATVTTSALAAVTALHDCGTFGTVSWGSADWSTPHVTVCTGPVMSSWLYRKAVGSDAHLVAWLEVRAFSGGEVQVLPWLENGYVNVASPTNKSATYGFSLNGVTKCAAVAIDLKHHQRTPLINGTSLWYWAGTDPGIVPIHDAAYLQSTELVPSYYSSLTAGNSRVLAQPTTFAPLQQGSFSYDSDSMASSGYQKPIGLLPEHDVLHLVAADSDRVTTFKSVVWNGYSAGRYGIHYRDESTNKPLRFQDHPTRVISDAQGFKDNGGSTTSTRTATATGGNPPTWDVAHCPSVGYMAHLLTGLRYFLEEAQFAATCNYLGNGDNSILRNGVQGLVQTAVNGWQTRSSAWDWRTHVQALTITPSTDQIYTDLVNRVHSNIDYFWSTYVNQANNSFGIIMPGETYSSSISKLAIWQQDMVTAAWGFSKSVGLPVDSTRSTRLDAFFAWKAQSVVGRMGTSSTFPFENANRYQIELGGSLTQNSYKLGTGPWPASWAAIYALTTPLAITPDNPLATADGNVLATEFDSISAAKVNWGMLQQAIAYAVRHSVSGASSANTRMTGATNWASMLTSQWAASYPVMGVKPLRDPVATPAWMSAAVLNRYTQVPNSAGSGGSAINAWGAFVVDEALNVYAPANGGHGDSFDNRVSKIALGVDTPTGWTVVNAASLNVPAPGGTLAADAAYYYDDAGGTTNPKPGSRHVYNCVFYDQTTRKIYLVGYQGTYPNGGSWNTIDAYDVDTNTWGAPGSNIFTGPTASAVYGGSTEGLSIFWAAPAIRKLFWTLGADVWKWTPGDASKTNLGAYAGSAWVVGGRYPSAYDSSRDAIYNLVLNNGQGGASTDTLTSTRISTPDGIPSKTNITLSASAALTQLKNDQPAYAAMDYDRLRDKFVFFAGGTFSSGGAVVSSDPMRIYDITPNSGSTWDVALATVASGGATPGALASGGINKRWTYIERGGIGGFLLLMNSSDSLYFFRTT